MKDTVKTAQETITTIASIEIEEVINTSISKKQVLVNEDDFCLIYSEFWNVIMEFSLSKTDIEMFAYLIKNHSDGSPFSITSYTKEEISKKTQKAVTSYNNCTRVLLKHNLIYQVKNRVYKISPRYAFKGSSKNRHKAVIEMVSMCKDC